MKLRKILIATAAAGVFALASCGGNNTVTTTETAPEVTTTAEKMQVMSYADYIAADDGTEVTIGAFLQKKTSYYNGTTSLYLENMVVPEDDEEEPTYEGYYVYGLKCTEEEYATLTTGRYMEITGSKSTWKGEAEINYGTATDNQGWSFGDSSIVKILVFDEKDVYDIKKETLDQYKNCKVGVNNLKVVGDIKYSWDGKGVEGDDIYFDVTDGTITTTVVIETSLEGCDKDSEVYTTAQSLSDGSEIDIEGFVYYYENAPQVQVSAIYATQYDRFMAREVDEEFTIDAYIQDRCTWYNNAASFYLADEEGKGYYVYNLACSEEEYATLTKGVHIKVTGAKSYWKGEYEINYGTATDNQGWEIVDEATTVYDATEVEDIATATLDEYKNQLVSVKNLTVTEDAKYNYDGSGEAKAGTDIYVTVSDGTNELTFVVESYLEGTQYGSATYSTVGALKKGDKIDLTGFVYYYDKPQMQITSCILVTE